MVSVGETNGSDQSGDGEPLIAQSTALLAIIEQWENQYNSETQRNGKNLQAVIQKCSYSM